MKKILVFIFLILCSFFLVGCWDAHELNTLFIVTGIAIDKSEQEGFIDVCIVGVRTNPSQAGISSGGNEDKTIVLETTTRNIREAFYRFNIDNDRTIYLQHNQVVIFGEDVAKDDLREHLDYFVRSENSRMETIILIVEGRADEVFRMDVKQEQNPAIFLSIHILTLSRQVKHYKVSILTFISELLTEGFESSIPIFAINKNDDDLPISMKGFAIFRDHKMVSVINQNDILGYVWLRGGAKNTNKTSVTEDGIISMDYDDVRTKREIIYENNIPVKVKVTVETLVRVEELRGFEKYSLQDLNQVIIDIAKHEIITVTERAFKTTQELKVDITGIGLSIYQFHPRKWRNLKYNWEEIYSNLEIEVIPKIHLKDFGQIISIFDQGGMR